MVGDVDDLLGEQPDVQRVQHCTHGWDREIGLEVLLVVPHERADAVVAGDPEPPKPIGQPGHAFTDTGVRRAPGGRTLPGHDLGIAAHAGAVLHDPPDRERNVLHRAAHGYLHRLTAAGPRPCRALSPAWR